MSRLAAPGFAAAATPSPDLAVAAVRDALARAGSDHANSVLLFLSPDHGHCLTQAIQATSKTANCLQVTGCTMPGLFTERAVAGEPEWALHQPCAAALVLCSSISLATVQPGAPDGGSPLLILGEPGPNLDQRIGFPTVRYGSLCNGNDQYPRGDVWSQCRLRAGGPVEARFTGADTVVSVSRGMQACSNALLITERKGFEIYSLGHRSALSTLRDAVPEALLADSDVATRCFAAVLESGVTPELALEDGRYALVPVIGINPHENSVTLAARLPERSILVWVRQDPESAQEDSRRILAELADEAPQPDFALMFSCIGRGPYFYQGADRDLMLLLGRHPALPVIGAYGSGEIGPIAGENTLLSYSTVYALVSATR